jgi:hypothetical protein
LLALTLSFRSPSLSPGVLRHPASLAQTLGHLAARCVSAAEPGCLAAHEINDATGRFQSRGPTRVVPLACQKRAENYGHQRSPMGNPDALRTGHAQVDPLPETTF